MMMRRRPYFSTSLKYVPFLAQSSPPQEIYLFKKWCSTSVRHSTRLPTPTVIQEAYQEEATDGILHLLRHQPELLFQANPQHVIQTTLQAAQSLAKPRAAAAGIWNAWMGACASLQTAKTAKALWDAMQKEKTNSKVYIHPDLVTYCLLYQATKDQLPDFADKIMKLALQDSKKQAGSKRRKVLAAARCQTNTSDDMDTELLQQSMREVLQDESLAILNNQVDFLVLSKPSGVTCYHTTTTTAGKISKKSKAPKDISLEDALVHCKVPLSTLNPEAQGLVHRLDRGTSGCMVWAKTNECHAQLVTDFFLRRVQKQYTALVSPAPKINTDSINLPIQGHPAISHVKLMEQFAYPTSDAALLQIEPKTGRRHQVRIHCAQGLGTPVVLDPIYSQRHSPPSWVPCHVHGTEELTSPQKPTNKVVSDRFFLHSSALTIPSLNLETEACVPAWWGETLDILRK